MKAIRNFFTEIPNGNIWKRITIYLILFRFVGFWSLIFSIPFLAGLLAPGGDIDFSEMSVTLAEAFRTTMQTLYLIGSNLAIAHPILSKIIALGFSHIFWIYWVGLFFLLIDIIRHLTAHSYSKLVKTQHIPTEKSSVYA